MAHVAVPGIPAGRVYFIVGLSSPKGLPPDAEWRTKVNEALDDTAELSRFQQWTDDYERYHRVALPQDVLRGTSLEEQGASLGRWVKETFTYLIAQGPPTTVKD